MSYLDQKLGLRQRLGAGLGVIAIQASLGLAVVTGLTVAGVVQTEDTWDPVINFPTVKPADPVPPDTPDASERISSRTVAPKPDTNLADDSTEAEVFDPGADPWPTATTGGADTGWIKPPPPLPAFAPVRPSPVGNTARWISTDNYPTRELRNGIEGVTGYRLVIGTDGKVSACEITTSSGNANLDRAACKHLERRARFEPAKDQYGNKVIGTYPGTVSWEIPD